LAIALLQYFYKSKSRSKGIILLAFLRFLGVFGILLLLINPKIESQVLETVKPKLVVVIDNSSSIKHLNSEAAVVDLIAKTTVNSVLNEKFDIDYLSFNNDIEQFDSLSFSGNRTNISQSLVSLDRLYKKNATVLLVTDGNQTLGADYSFYKSKSKIFPIVVGDTTKHDDIKISKLNVNKYAFLGNNFPIELFINYDGEISVSSILTVKSGNSIVFRKNIALSRQKNSEQVTFTLPADKVGVKNYNATISYLINEKNTINNRKSFTVEVIDEQSKIAIVSDITHPDLGMLKRSIETNKQRKVVFLSPDATIDVKNYQLLILYQPTSSFSKLFKEIEEFKSPIFIITGTQTDWDFLNAVQQDFEKNAISQTEDYIGIFNPDYSAFVVENIDLENLSPLQDYFGDAKFNTQHEVLLFQNIDGYETKNPLLATFTKDDRRGAVLFGENSWKWRAMSHSQHKSFTNFDNFINKLVQYLATTKKFNRVELDYLPIVYQNDLVKISATYFDANYAIDSRAELMLNLRNSRTKELKKYPFRLNKNKFEVNLSNLESGDYVFSVTVNNQNISSSGNFTVLDYNIEQQFTYANTEALHRLALNSNGRLQHIDKNQLLIDELLRSSDYKSIQKSIKKTVPLIDWKWLLGCIIFFFSLEWFIRKYRGLV
jgi:hypothetical protein